MRPRGQSAIEYMMTYGWGVLVVLVAGVVLWQLGFLDMGSNVTPDKRGFSQVTPLDWGMGTDSNLRVVIQNNAGTIVSIKDTGTDAYVIIGGTGSGLCSGAKILPFVTSGDIRPGATTNITFTSCPLSSTKVGVYYKVNMTIAYVNPASGLSHKSNGVLWGPLG
jgi:hypothetical protein